MTWTDAGAAWGARAADWATLIDPWSVPIYRDVLDRLAPQAGEHALDMACGSGMASLELRHRGIKTAGLDASAQLVDIAVERIPDGDFRVGDISELPWADGEFDLVTSFNGIWGLERPLAEARRVLRSGGRFGISFFGSFENMDIMNSWVIALMECSPPDDSDEDLMAISHPGAAERMVARAGMTPIERGATVCAQEFADLDTAVRAYSALGPAWAAINHVGAVQWSTRLGELFEPYRQPSGIVRLVNEWGWLTASG
jgi:SAM-dependent methyltransferase